MKKKKMYEVTVFRPFGKNFSKLETIFLTGRNEDAVVQSERVMKRVIKMYGKNIHVIVSEEKIGSKIYKYSFQEKKAA